MSGETVDWDKALSFGAVSFGKEASKHYLQIRLEGRSGAVVFAKGLSTESLTKAADAAIAEAASIRRSLG